ncbi:MAG TPA: CocE/NonD family hydrolase [Nitriliruptorales bacterium]|nr:CocE/NonD family hydrolase [Nitriliruptorales bacterium]
MGLVAAAMLAVAAAPVRAQAGASSVTTEVVASFDGTPILAHLFLPAGASGAVPVPLVLRTHGWGGTGQTQVSGMLASLLDAGYAVLTWDQRGFGCSGGVVQLDKPEWEGRDAAALIDWAVANFPIATEGGDPIVGFTGGSYAGGIQTAAAAIDPRIDALGPEISWQDLRYSLYAGQVATHGWGEVLYLAGVATAHNQGLDPSCPTFPQEGGLAEEIHRGHRELVTTNQVSEEVLDFLAGSSLGGYGDEHPVDVPTLVINGSVDTLFDLTEGARIVDHVRAHGGPAKYVVFCGGHVSCPPGYGDADDRAHIDRAVLTWFARYLKGEDVDTGAPVEYRTNAAEWRDADAFPPPGARPLSASGEGAPVVSPLPTTADAAALAEALRSSGGSVPANPLVTAQLNPAGDPHAFTVPVAAADSGALELVGIPSATVTVSGSTSGPAHLFLKLVDREAGHVVNLQEAPLRVDPVTAEPRTFDVTMPGIAYTLAQGHHLDLQVATTSTMHAGARHTGQLQVAVDVEVPSVGTVPAPPSQPAPFPAVVPADAGSARAAPAASAAPPASLLPATGGAGALLALTTLTVVAALRRRRGG